MSTHFGYETVEEHEKAKKVAEVFHRVAAKYDVMNDLMSFGMHRLWKNTLVRAAFLRENQNILDVAGGTGDIAARMHQVVRGKANIILSDINAAMLQEGRMRLINQGITNIQYVLADAECLPFQSDYFDRITMAFGLRNVTHQDKALSSLYRVLKPGGKCLILEFSKPVLPGLSAVYDGYSFGVIPKIGKVILNDSASYQYLAESIRMHPPQETLAQMMRTAGFEKVDYENMAGGIVAMHWGYKC